MQKMDAKFLPEDFDLNLLRFLQVLLDTASVTRAGEKLQISQPAASRAIAKLRRHFGDPLLVRSGRSYLLTPLALQLAPQLRQVLSGAQALFEHVGFDPTSATRQFRIATTDYGMSTVLLDLIAHLRTQGSLLGLSIDPWGDQTLEKLERGDLDAALFVDEGIPPDFHKRVLFNDAYALVCGLSHPLAEQANLSPRKLLQKAAAYPQFAARYPLPRGYATDDVYTPLGLEKPRMAIEAPYFYAGSYAVQSADLVAILPQRAALAWSHALPLKVIPLALPELAFEYSLIWHERSHRDPGMKWLRQLIAEQVKVKSCS